MHTTAYHPLCKASTAQYQCACVNIHAVEFCIHDNLLLICMIVAVVVVYHYTTITDSVPHPSGGGALELLKDMDGYAKPGTMTALMGSSGAGK